MSLRGRLAGIAVRAIGGKEGAAMWEWMNGKKTAIGLTCVAIGSTLSAASSVIGPALEAWGISSEAVASVMSGIGWVVTGVGSVHRVVKEL